jgi:hypothetical protein
MNNAKIKIKLNVAQIFSTKYTPKKERLKGNRSQISLQCEAVSCSDEVAATREIATPPVEHPFMLKGNLKLSI